MFLEPISPNDVYQNGWQAYLPLFSAITALAAVIIGPIASYKIAIRQVKLAARENERKEWLQSLRTDISTLLASMIRFVISYDQNRKPESRETIEEAAESFYRQSATIWIRLDPDIPNHKELGNKLHEIWEIWSNSAGMLSEEEVPIFFHLTEDVITIAGRITISELGKK